MITVVVILVAGVISLNTLKYSYLFKTDIKKPPLEKGGLGEQTAMGERCYIKRDFY